MKRFAPIAVLLFALLLAGCSPSDPLDQVVEASSKLDYDIWANHHLGALSPADAAHYTKAFDELRIFSVTQWGGRPPEEQMKHVLDQIHGLKVRTVIAQGLLFANRRLELLVESDQATLQRNEGLQMTPNTREQRRVLELTHKDIAGRIALNEREIRRNEIVIRSVTHGEYTAATDPQRKPSV